MCCLKCIAYEPQFLHGCYWCDVALPHAAHIQKLLQVPIRALQESNSCYFTNCAEVFSLGES